MSKSTFTATAASTFLVLALLALTVATGAHFYINQQLSELATSASGPTQPAHDAAANATPDYATLSRRAQQVDSAALAFSLLALIMLSVRARSRQPDQSAQPMHATQTLVVPADAAPETPSSATQDSGPEESAPASNAAAHTLAPRANEGIIVEEQSEEAAAAVAARLVQAQLEQAVSDEASPAPDQAQRQAPDAVPPEMAVTDSLSEPSSTAAAAAPGHAQALLEHVSDGLLILDQALNIVGTPSPRAHQLLGQTTLVGSSLPTLLGHLLPAPALADARAYVAAVCADAGAVSRASLVNPLRRVRLPEAPRQTLALELTRLDAPGAPARLLLRIRDVSDMARTEHALEEAQAHLQIQRDLLPGLLRNGTGELNNLMADTEHTVRCLTRALGPEIGHNTDDGELATATVEALTHLQSSTRAIGLGRVADRIAQLQRTLASDSAGEEAAHGFRIAAQTQQLIQHLNWLQDATSSLIEQQQPPAEGESPIECELSAAEVAAMIEEPLPPLATTSQRLANDEQAAPAAAAAAEGSDEHIENSAPAEADAAVPTAELSLQTGADLQRTLSELALETAEREGKEVTMDTAHFAASLELPDSLAGGVRDIAARLIHNAITHGIETPEVREQAGKPAQGRVGIAFARKGHRYQLAVVDDGAGLDVALIRQAALRLNMIDTNTAERLSDAQWYAFLLRKGFSVYPPASEEATPIDQQAHGTGLCEVAERVRELGGQIRIRSRAGEKTLFHVTLSGTRQHLAADAA